MHVIFDILNSTICRFCSFFIFFVSSFSYGLNDFQLSKLLKPLKYQPVLADISFAVIDLKYNQKKGVKICEMQPASFSRFSGSRALIKQKNPAASEDECNIIPHLYCDFLSNYNIPVYYTDRLEENMIRTFQNFRFSYLKNPFSLAEKNAKKISDRSCIKNYSFFVFSNYLEYILKQMPSHLPSVLFLDQAILPYSCSKQFMNAVFESSPESKSLRPVCCVYKKGDPLTLSLKIEKEIPGEIVVIKPLRATMGRGVIIVEKKNLFSTLEYILTTPQKTLIEDEDRSYSYYAQDTSKHFIVEEFVESDPLFLGEESLPYDCTMRIMVIFTYDKNVMALNVLDGYWYSPKKPLSYECSLTESHKAKGTYFFQTDKLLLQEIENQIRPGLLKAYKTMLQTHLTQPTSKDYNFLSSW